MEGVWLGLWSGDLVKQKIAGSAWSVKLTHFVMGCRMVSLVSRHHRLWLVTPMLFYVVVMCSVA